MYYSWKSFGLPDRLHYIVMFMALKSIHTCTSSQIQSMMIAW